MGKNYTPEEISYEDAGVLTLCNDQLRRLVAISLSIVPKEVADRVLEDCLFLMPVSDYMYGFFVEKELAQNKCIIVLSEKLLELDEKSAVHTVLHEVAHYFLGHRSPILADLTEKDTRGQEVEADRTVSQWLEVS